ncbi:MAG: M90 family metallopeptidase [Spirochaetota bacterium]
MEAVFTRRYKINLLFSLIVSIITAIVAANVVSFLLRKFFPDMENLTGVITASVFIFLHFFITRKYRKRKKIASIPFPEKWKKILSDLVFFYRTLSDDEKYYFEKKVQIFLAEKIITGIGTEVDDSTKLLIASAAIIPVFKIEDWEYDTLGEILVYPDRFDHNYNFKSGDRDVLGMVEQHASSLIISKKELFRGFASMDGGNTAIHEFIHKIDEEDGVIDGLPLLMLNREELGKWKTIRESEMEKIESGRSDIDSYALTEEAEFLAVAGEEFFEHPEKMKKNSPELYDILKSIFKQDTASIIKSEALAIFKKKRNRK